MTNFVAADEKHTVGTTVSRHRVSFRPIVEISLVTSLQEMTLEERRRKWVTTEDKITSQKDMCLSVFALQDSELGESDKNISNHTPAISNEASAEVCYRGIEHHKSKFAREVRQTIKQEHVATILREQQAYRLGTGRSRGTPTLELAKLSYRNSRYSRQRAIKLAVLDEEYANYLREEDEAPGKTAEEANEKNLQQSCSGFHHEAEGKCIQPSGQRSDEKKAQHQSKNVGIVHMKQKQNFPSCA